LNARVEEAAVYVERGSILFMNCTLTGNYAAKGSDLYNAGRNSHFAKHIVADDTVGLLEPLKATFHNGDGGRAWAASR